MSEFISEVARLFWGAGLWWAALLVVLLGALLVVAVRRGWIKPPTYPGPEPRHDDVNRDGVPEATWDENVERNDKPDAGGGG